MPIEEKSGCRDEPKKLDWRAEPLAFQQGY
jgi:hypothetical protein